MPLVPEPGLGAEGSRVLAVGVHGPAGEGWHETMGVSQPQFPVSTKWEGGVNRGEDREALPSLERKAGDQIQF